MQIRLFDDVFFKDFPQILFTYVFLMFLIFDRLQWALTWINKHTFDNRNREPEDWKSSSNKFLSCFLIFNNR